MVQHFTITARDATTRARTGVLRTAHGDIPTPCFMPIATVGAVKHVTPAELRVAGADIILSNTYHLALRPGTDFLAHHGGLHQFMGWDGPILTDSGGFQVFSLGARVRRGGSNLVMVDEDGVTFRSHIDGSERRFTPESVMDHQRNIGSDIAMVLDVCPPQPCTHAVLAEAVDRTTRWAERARAHVTENGARRTERQLLFGIVQGGADEMLRRASAAGITAFHFDGYAIGGVAVGEEKAAIRVAIEMTASLLPDDRPRYLMGLGTPDDLLHAVAQGVDMFDCVLPTRDGRHGRVYARVPHVVPQLSLSREHQAFYHRFDLTAAAQRDSSEPIDPTCACPACVQFSRAYLRHLFAVGEPLGQRLATIHNLTFYLSLMREVREGMGGP